MLRSSADKIKLYIVLHVSCVFAYVFEFFRLAKRFAWLLLFPALRSKMKQKALKECDYYASRYAECATGRTFSVVWQCRKQAKELNDCLHH